MALETEKPINLPLPNDENHEGHDNSTENGVLREKEDSEKPKPNEILIKNEENVIVSKMVSTRDHLLRPNSYLPRPEPPPGLKKPGPGPDPVTDPSPIVRSVSDISRPSFTKLFRDSLVKRISSLRDEDRDRDGYDRNSMVTEINLSGLKVVVQMKKQGNDDDDDDDDGKNLDIEFKGRISFFSRSGCRDCSAVRSFFRSKNWKFVEINLDVYPEREKEMIGRSKVELVPQIYLNDKYLGGLVEMNEMRKSGELERRVREEMARRSTDNSPAAPVYGFDYTSGDERLDELVGIVRVLRSRLPIQDRISRMKIVRNCFTGTDLVEVLIQHFDCGRKKAIEIGKALARKHFIHHVFQENDFEDGNHLYRFLEHEPTIPRCLNFRGSTNDNEPKPAKQVGQKLRKMMIAILEAYASEDRRIVDYDQISKSEEFRRYVSLVQDLQRVDISGLSEDEKMAFFLNLYNAMVIHAVIRVGCPEGVIDRRTFYGDFYYIVGGYPYSLATIKNGILRSNRRQPYSLIKPFSTGDKRLEVALLKVNPLIHFGLCNGTRSSPIVQFFSEEGIEAELRVATRKFFANGGMDVNLDKRTICLSRIIKWYSIDFGQEKEILKWIIKYLDATKAGLLTHLISDGGPINFVYQNYDWSLNS